MEVKSINQHMKYLLHSNHITAICLFVANGKELYAESALPINIISYVLLIDLCLGFWGFFLSSLYSRRRKYMRTTSHVSKSIISFYVASSPNSLPNGDLTLTSFWKNGLNSIVFAFEVIHLPVNLLFSKFSFNFP